MRTRWICLLGAAWLAGCGDDPPDPETPQVVERTETDAFGLITCSPETADRTCFTHRMIAGVSMGSSGAGQLGFGRPELFDSVAMLGISIVDWVYMMRLIENYHLGGFCDLETILANLDAVDDPDGPAFCGPVRGVEKLEPTGALVEADQDFNHWYRWIDEGRGGSFGRNKLRESLQDIALAFGNAFYFNEASTYFPAGVPLDYRERDKRERCEQPLSIAGVHHHRYNPDGRYPVLAFCDTVTNSGDVGPGAVEPMEIMLSVDYNENGRRDYAEPVIIFPHEPFEDVGDGENDRYDWDTNPAGKAQNFRYDEGEPFSDTGLDGVPNTGDFGEGNGRFDYNPNMLNYFAQNPRHLIEGMDEGQLARLNIWADAGIRDFLMSAAGTNWLWGALRNRVGGLARDYTSFFSLVEGRDYDFLAVDYAPEALGRHAYVRYGRPDASEREIMRGDGHHVGPPDQVLNRFLSSISFMQSRIYQPDVGAVDEVGDVVELIEPKEYYSEALGRTWRYGIVFPPGYNEPENADKTYPVMYFLHGQGMESDHLLASGILFFGYMAGSANRDTQRRRQSDWAKFILVFPNSKCPDDGECSSGNFNANHVGLQGDGPRYADGFYDLMAHIESTYRVRVPVEVPKELL